MRLSRAAVGPLTLTLTLVLALLGAGLAFGQEPLAAGADGVPVPKKKKHVQPVYPAAALAQGIRGIVILDLVIDTDGRVARTSIIRSIPGLDEAALVAARQWVYEPVKVGGQPVSVRLTVPVTFALKLPDMARDDGIPELRQGVTPPWPETGGRGGGQAVADVTLEPDGRIGLARILQGDEPWSTSLLQALRTWRFRSPPDDATLSFRVAAEFIPGRDKGTVRLSLSGLREAQLFDAPPEGPDRATAAEPLPLAPAGPAEPDPDASEPTDGRPETADLPDPPKAEPGPAPLAAAEPAAATDARPETADQPDPPAGQPGAPTPEAPQAVAEGVPGPNLATPTPAAPAAEPESPRAAPPAPAETAAAPRAAGPAGAPVAPQSAPAGPGSAPSAGQNPIRAAAEVAPAPAPGPPSAAPPPVEILSPAPPPLPPENGISAIRGVELEPGVPDLTRGRRPVSPPFARMQGASGEVTVEFSVSAGGVTAVQRTDGPEVLQTAATQAVASWIFRRTRADRAYLVAVFTYEDDLANAVVRPQAAP